MKYENGEFEKRFPEQAVPGRTLWLTMGAGQLASPPRQRVIGSGHLAAPLETWERDGREEPEATEQPAEHQEQDQPQTPAEVYKHGTELDYGEKLLPAYLTGLVDITRSDEADQNLDF